MIKLKKLLITFIAIFLVSCSGLIAEGEIKSKYQKLIINEEHPISDELMKSNYYEEYVTKICNGVKDVECEARFQTVFGERLKQKYTHADFDQIKDICKAKPIECNNLLGLEKITKENHNTNLNVKMEEEIQNYNNNQTSSFDWGRFFRAFGSGMQQSSPQTTHCRSYYIGNQLNTDCN